MARGLRDLRILSVVWLKGGKRVKRLEDTLCSVVKGWQEIEDTC